MNDSKEMMSNYYMWFPLVVLCKIIVASLATAGGLALYDKKQTLFSFTWKRVLSFCLLSFGIKQLISVWFFI
jgi:hypothetical protein